MTLPIILIIVIVLKLNDAIQNYIHNTIKTQTSSRMTAGHILGTTSTTYCIGGARALGEGVLPFRIDDIRIISLYITF